jgi:hypothetical protein
MKSSPWYSTERLEDDDDAVPVYHDNIVCKEGKVIERNFRRYGTDNRPLCKRCATLDATGK